MTIPAEVHFCWIGRSLPWAYVFAVLSAAERGGVARVTFHHTDVLADGPEVRALREAPRVSLAPLDAERCLDEVGRSIGVGEALVILYRAVIVPVTRADILRAAILYRNGGIYLDLDTVTVAALHPLLTVGQFVGTEFIVWPQRARQSRSPITLARHVGLDLLRKLCRALPEGWRMFRLVERFYVRAVNNAVIGAEPGSPFLADYLRAMSAVPPDRARRSYALGPILLQDMVDRSRAEGGLAIHPPQVFYPLSPEISEHWFRRRRAVPLRSVLSPETRVVHWYASVRTRARVLDITPETVLARRSTELYSALVHSCLPDFFGRA